MENKTDTINAVFDPASPTSGIQEAIDALGDRGGCVRIPAGEWPLRRSVVLASRVQLSGDGPATELTIVAPKRLSLVRDARKGTRSVHVRGRVPFAPGDAVALVDNPRQWWDGTHAVVKAVEGRLIRLNTPLVRGLKVKEDARIVSMFPGITTPGSGSARKPTQDAVLRDLVLRGPNGSVPPYGDFTFSAVHLVHYCRSRVFNISVSDWPSDGIGVQGGRDVQVTHCQVSSCQGNGFHLGTTLERSVWSHNIATGNGGDGLFICWMVRDSVISDNVFTGNMNGIGGVGYGDDHHNVISNNVCSENTACGIYADDLDVHPNTNKKERGNYLITGNMLRNNSQGQPGAHPALRLHNVQYFLVQGNRCVDDREQPTQTRGIVESGDSDWNLVSGNLCVGMAEPVTVVGQNSRAEGNLG